MANMLHILLIEDSQDDTLLLLHELRRGGYEPIWMRVDTAAGVAAELERTEWDIITCDYVMPRFSALAALQIIHDHAVDTPVIIVSGEVGEEVAAATMRAGAHDYVSKHKLVRLVPAIQRELREAEERRARRRAEEALRESEARFSNAFEYAPIGMSIVGIDGRTLRVNRALAQMFGYSADEMVDLPVWRFTHPDDMLVTIEQMQRLLDGTQATWHLEKRFIHRDGHLVWGISSTSLVRGTDGRPLYVISQVLDVTERKRTEQALREREQRLRAIIEQASDLIFTLDPVGRISSVNHAACELTGYQAEELIGRSPLELVDRVDTSRAQRALGQILSGEDVDLMEVEIVSKDGRRLLLEVRGRTIFEGERLVATFHIARQIGARRHAAADAPATDRA